jgi:hypothetical protein
MGSLYNANFTGTLMILMAGQQEQGHGLMEPLLYGPLVRIAESHCRVLGPVPSDEIWEFQPGLVVRAQLKRLSGGNALVAVANATN